MTPRASTDSRTPSASKIGMDIGSSDSPIWKRGWRSFSIWSTRCPSRASMMAVALPPGPPPTTNTSAVSPTCINLPCPRPDFTRLYRSLSPVEIWHCPMTQTAAEAELAMMIVAALNLEDIDAAAIDPDAALFGQGLGLDSIDALELSLEIAKRYGVQ